MKQLLNQTTEPPPRPIHSRRGPMTRGAAAGVLLGASVLACSDGSSSPRPSVPATQPDTAGLVPPAGGGVENAGVADGTAGEADGNAAETAGMTMGAGGAPPVAEGVRPELIADGAGETAGMDGAATAASGGAAGAAGAQGVAGSSAAPEDEWVPLFNGTNLDGWVVHGTMEPLFAVENGEIHVYPTQADQSNQPQANLRSTTSLGGKYTLHVEYRWGEARFSDRRQTARDAGILFHIGGDVTRVWPDSIECQIGSSPVNGDWVTGDLWVIGTPTTAQTLDDNAQLQTRGGGFGFSAASAQAENPHGEWNAVDVIIDGAAEAVYMVNGVEVNRVFNMARNGQPLSEGFVSVQAEYAELFYRDLRYKLDE